MGAEEVTGLALVGVLGGAVVRQLRRRKPEEATAESDRSESMEARLAGVGQAWVQAAGVAVLTAGRVGAVTVQHAIPAAATGAGWLLDGVTGLIADTGRGAASAVSHVPRPHFGDKQDNKEEEPVPEQAAAGAALQQSAPTPLTPTPEPATDVGVQGEIAGDEDLPTT